MTKSIDAADPPLASVRISDRARENEAQPLPPAADGGRLHALKAALASHQTLNGWIHVSGNGATGQFEGGRFESAFVPLIGDADSDVSRPGEAPSRQPVAWRAKLRAFDKAAILVSSAAAFSSIENDALLVAFDRMTRTLHCLNYFSSNADGLLFLAVHERLLRTVRHDHGKRFAEVLLSLQINPARVVIDIPVEIAGEPRFLDYLIDSYHGHGFKVSTNVARLHRHVDLLRSRRSPEFVIVDSEQGASESAVRHLSRVVARGGSQLIFDGAENDAVLAEKFRLGARYLWAPAAVDLPKGTPLSSI